MKTIRSLLLFLVLFAAIPLPAAQRVVVLELFTGTWCSYCPGAALGADDLADAYPGRVLVVEYHSGLDTFVNDVGIARHLEFYGDYVAGMPTAIFDGTSIVAGGDTAASMFPTYDVVFATRKDVDPDLEITLEKTESGYLEQGTLSATVKNVSGDEITGRVLFTVTESNIPYQWRNQSELHFVERDMLPDEEGELITLAPGETETIERNYETGSGWPHYTEDLDNVEFGCFVQDTTTFQLYQSDTLPPGRLAQILQAAILPAAGSSIVEKTPPSAIHLDVPSIASGRATLKISVSSPSRVELNLFDAAGRRVRTVFSGTLKAGTHVIDLPTADLAPGVYFVSTTSVDYGEIAKRLIIL